MATAKPETETDSPGLAGPHLKSMPPPYRLMRTGTAVENRVTMVGDFWHSHNTAALGHGQPRKSI